MAGKDWSTFFEDMEKELGIQPRTETESEKEFRILCEDYLKATGEYLPIEPPMGYPDIERKELVQFAKAAIAARKPIDWDEALGIPLYERDKSILA